MSPKRFVLPLLAFLTILCLGEAQAAYRSPTGASPLLLLESPGWRIQNTQEDRGRGDEGVYGSIEFVTGKPIPY